MTVTVRVPLPLVEGQQHHANGVYTLEAESVEQVVGLLANAFGYVILGGANEMGIRVTGWSIEPSGCRSGDTV